MELNELRNQIDKVDDQIVQLFVERMGLSAQIADYKKENKLPIYVFNMDVYGNLKKVLSGEKIGTLVTL